jgi:CBS-domain-containing membrane protein
MRTLTARDVMTLHVKTVFADETITSADWDMAVNEIRHLPVLDRERRVVGMISDRDVLRAMIEHRGHAATVGDMMARVVKTVTPMTSAAEAVELMLRGRCHALPVVDEQRRLLGIVTATDFLELAHRALQGMAIDAPHVRA